ncbi:MAG TPA: nucleotidyl transferase AbiEii/AbiGii toxin family protein [Sphingomonas sp.]|uniref:nucleotidyl transferase AbiEii/AbiGii toxin family protein n=1 Tax=Sphingomonas sp. TaxID=28214 RepID=UPI002CD5ED82|nr:nucleotidyl transferase AbiEii/AbiGii toxin family protein [Sphingomonas sp.]HMI20094.1 nucleotidyl transferase AbiEii/AbiGii toxin family protein [Sphingomonas sp.]
MSDPADEPVETVDVDIRGWVEKARADPQLHRDRQVTEIVLAAIGLSKSLQETLVLKGGTLMAIAFGSNRVTGDVDFTSLVPPDGFETLLKTELDAKLEPAAIKLGYLDLRCRVQGIKRYPRSDNFEGADFPALELRVGSAERGTTQEVALAEGRASRTLYIEISFRDQVYAFQDLYLEKPEVAVQAFTLEELIAEKFRALLQQPIRKRNRRQDVFDIAYLIETNTIDDASRAKILTTLVDKCRSRGIDPNADSLDNPEVSKRAQKEWETLRLELRDLPPFGDQFVKVAALITAFPGADVRASTLRPDQAAAATPRVAPLGQAMRFGTFRRRR